MSASAGVVRRAVSAAGRTLAVTSCRALSASGVAATVLWTSGCYSYLPKTESEVTPKTVVAANISDAGRVALGERIGAEVARIEGKVVQRSDTAVNLMVSEVRYLNGLSNQWQGQEISLRPVDVKQYSQRTFSRSRTAIMLGAAAVGVVLAILSLNFLGIISGDPSPDKGGGGPPPES